MTRPGPSRDRQRPTPTRLVEGDRRDLWHRARGSVVRAVLLTTTLFLLYAFAPLGQRVHGSVAIGLVASLLLLTAATVLEIRSVARSPYPELRAIEAIAVTVPLVLLPFAAAYFVTAHNAAGSFNESLSRLDALYFTMTVFSTVGFGDIVAKSEPARLIVMVQMSVNLILIGLIVKVLLGAAQRRRQDLGLTAKPADEVDAVDGVDGVDDPTL